MSNTPVAWSHSVLEAFASCPRRYNLINRTKTIKEPPSKEMAYGQRVHKDLEAFLQFGKPLPEDINFCAPIAETIRKKAVGGKLDVEQKMTLNANFQPTSWFAKDAWVRGITDFTIYRKDKAFIGDWKTGNPKDNPQQLKLTSALTFATQPHVNEIINTFVWLKTNSISTPFRVTRNGMKEIWQEFMPKVAELQKAVDTNTFIPKPSGLCKNWCPVTKEHCEFGK